MYPQIKQERITICIRLISPIRQLFTKLIFLVVLFFSLSANAQNVIIDGNALLEFQTNHSGIMVFFERTAPTPFTDSTFTDSTGQFSISIPTGIYNLTYSKTDFISCTNPNNLFFANATVVDTTLESLGLYGNISGILNPGTYKVGDTLTVASGDTLIILPGTQLLFKANKSLIVNGYIIANGTSTDSILFSRYDSTNWAGILLNQNLNPSSSISFAEIEYSEQAICSDQNLSQLSDIYMHLNSSGLRIYGQGASNTYLNFLIENNLNNTNIFSSSGVSIIGGEFDTIRLVNFKILNNTDLNFNNSYSAGGIHLAQINIKIYNSIIAGNRGRTGGLLFESSRGGLEIINSTISNNTSTSFYPGAGGIYYDGYQNPIKIYNSIISFNTAHNLTDCGGIFARAIRTPEIRFTNFYLNYPTDYCSDTMTFINYSVMLNSNGDSCDVYSNIMVDPEFNDTLLRDYHLSANSNLIDAGSNNYILYVNDQDGNPRIMDGDFNTSDIVDMGPYESLGSVGVLNVPYLEFAWLYPNPFLSELHFYNNSDRASELIIYDLSGRIVYKSYIIKDQTLNLDQIQSGIYFAQIISNLDKNVVKLVKQ